jgi:hypothetical protein
VEVVAVELGDHLAIRPDAVDELALDVDVELWAGDAGAADQLAEV